QSLAQANEAASRAAQSARAFDVWKRKIRGLLTAADYRWDDDSPFVRIPKAILPQLSEQSDAEPFRPGVVAPYARELIGLTSAERQAVATTLQRQLSDVDARIYETNLPVTGAIVARRLFVLSGSREEANRIEDLMLAELHNLLGEDRWPLVAVRLSEK